MLNEKSCQVCSTTFQKDLKQAMEVGTSERLTKPINNETCDLKRTFCAFFNEKK
jgi:hypothetical protein